MANMYEARRQLTVIDGSADVNVSSVADASSSASSAVPVYTGPGQNLVVADSWIVIVLTRIGTASNL